MYEFQLLFLSVSSLEIASNDRQSIDGFTRELFAPHRFERSGAQEARLGEGTWVSSPEVVMIDYIHATVRNDLYIMFEEDSESFLRCT